MIPNLKYGFVKYNTKYIPTFISEGVLTTKSFINGPFHIKSDIPIELNIGGRDYTLDSGEHYIHNFNTYHELRIMTDLSNPNIQVYHNCIVEDYYSHFCSLITYNVCIDSIRFGSGDKITVFANGMCTYSTHDELVSSIMPKDNEINFSNDFRWIHFYDSKIYIQKDKNKYTHSSFIYDWNIANVQNDEKVTQYLVSWDKGFVRSSAPPCILIIYTEEKYIKLKDILKRKYNINLEKGKPNEYKVRTIKSYEDICSQITKHNNLLQEGSFYDFVTLKEVPFTLEIYEKMKEQYPSDKPLPPNDFIIL